MKLHQVIALLSGKKDRIQRLLGNVHHRLKNQTVSGMERAYTPYDDKGHREPSESKPVQHHVRTELNSLRAPLIDLIDITARQESANQCAVADVKVNGKVVLGSCPVTFLLALEKVLDDLRTLVEKTPDLPSDKVWDWNPSIQMFESLPEVTVRTKKRYETLELVKPTEHQPGQAQAVPVDDPIGTWSTRYLSGALGKETKENVLLNINALRDAVKVARQEANSVEAPEFFAGEAVMNFVFGE